MFRKGMKTAKTLFGIVAALAIGGFILAEGVRDYRDSQRLKAESKTTPGKVLDHRTAYRSKGRTKHYLTVEFQTDQNQTITQEVLVNKDTHRAAASSGTTTVHYLPSNPAICQAGEKIESPVKSIIIGSLILVCGLIGIVYLIRPAKKELTGQKISSDPNADLSNQHEEPPRKAA
jgi:hypothetical protein